MYLKRDKFLIVGISKSGYSSCKLLLSKGAECYIYDKEQSVKVKKYIDELANCGAKLVNGENIEDVISLCDTIVLSPGIPIDNSIPVSARRQKKNIIGELELGGYFTSGPLIAITGTNGKTTTSYLTEYILQSSGLKCYTAGNIGIPLCDVCCKKTEEEIGIIEVSSFQLETVARFTPHVACILNITPDHLSRHYNMDNYVYLKSRILRNLRESEYAVLNADDARIVEFSMNTRAKIVFFSMTKEVDGAYVKDGKVYWKGEYLFDVDLISLKGGHNIQNVLASVCICKIFGVEKSIIRDRISDFKGVKHRLQEVAEINGVKYINDSKSTNPDSTKAAVRSFTGETILLIGGKYKQEGYKELFIEIKDKVKEIILYGENRKQLYDYALEEGINKVSVIENFVNAVRFASIIAQGGDTVLLSPACSSFDEFSCFEERGERFIEIVKQMGTLDT